VIIAAVDGQPGAAVFDDLLSYLARNTRLGKRSRLTILRKRQGDDRGPHPGGHALSNSRHRQQRQCHRRAPIWGHRWRDCDALESLGRWRACPRFWPVSRGKRSSGAGAGPAPRRLTRRVCAPGTTTVTLSGRQDQESAATIILSVDGVPVPTLDDLTALLRRTSRARLSCSKFCRARPVGDRGRDLG